MKIRSSIRWAVALGLFGLLAGCDDANYDHEPPAGKGSLIIDNFTGDRVLVYLDGHGTNSVSAGNDRAYDLRPGLYRVALDGEDVNRSWADDVDVLEGRRTVIEVRGATYYYDPYDVNVYFD